MQQGPAKILLALIITLAATSAACHSQSLSGRQASATNQSPTDNNGFLFVSPANTSNLPVNSTLTVGIHVSNMSSFVGWDVYVETNPSIITPSSANFTSDLFETNSTPPATPTIIGDCINGVSYTAAQCYQPSGPGIIEFAAAVLSSKVPTPLNGLLFNITYKVVAPGSGSLIQIISATLANGSSSISPSTVDGVYGNPPPDFKIAANPPSITVAQGLNETASVNLISTFGFQGTMMLTSTGNLGISISNPTLTLASGGTATSKLTIITGDAQATRYTEIITASNGTTPNSISHFATLTVSVVPASYFLMGISPSLLKIHAGDSGNTTITLESFGFNGNVTLNIQAPLELGVTYSLGTQNLTLRGDPNPLVAKVYTTLLIVSTPITALPFHYRINVTATGLSVGQPPLVQHYLLKVDPPPVSFLVSVRPTTIVVRAGETDTAIMNVRSVDYFSGFLYASAVMSGGAVEFNSSIYYIALPNSPNVTYVPQQDIGISVRVDPSTPPGNYIALVTVYSLASGGQRAYSTQIPVQVLVTTPVLRAANQVFGLPSWIYFTILAALAVPLVFFSIQTYRRREKEDEDWRA